MAVDDSLIQIQLFSEDLSLIGETLNVPVNVTRQQLQQLVNQVLKLDEPVLYTFYIDDQEIRETLIDIFTLDKLLNSEKIWSIICQPQAIFRIQPVTRCTSSIPGHGEAITCLSFSPDGTNLASGSGDCTVRLWDLHCESPLHSCKEHSNWVLCLQWSPDGKKLSSACKNGVICIWNPADGQKLGRPLSGHKKWVTCLAWQPLHRDPNCQQLASSSKDGDIRIWNTVLGSCLLILSGHQAAVTCIRWGGERLLYSASQDRTIKVWRTDDGVLCRTLDGHGHWVNTMALNTDYALRTGAYNPANSASIGEMREEELQKLAEQRYSEIKGSEPERLVSGSDDFTLYLWRPAVDKRPIARLTGHQQLINCVQFSPDGRWLASASFDKSVKLWCGRTGKFLASLRGHVQPVYMLSWSSDSRLIVSASADSTLKLWDKSSKRLIGDLPGHADEVYAVDWSPQGEKVASGGKDKILKLWRK